MYTILLYAKTDCFTSDHIHTFNGSCIIQIASIKGNDGLLTNTEFRIKEQAEKFNFLKKYHPLPCEKFLSRK